MDWSMLAMVEERSEMRFSRWYLILDDFIMAKSRTSEEKLGLFE